MGLKEYLFNKRGDELTLEEIKNNKIYVEMIKMVHRLGGYLKSGDLEITV